MYFKEKFVTGIFKSFEIWRPSTKDDCISFRIVAMLLIFLATNFCHIVRHFLVQNTNPCKSQYVGVCAGTHTPIPGNNHIIKTSTVKDRGIVRNMEA